MKKWVYLAVILVVLVLAVLPMFFREGPYGGKDQAWYAHHPDETAKELAWCQSHETQGKATSCQYARNAAVAGMSGD
ncbi:MAG: hypothetical protein PHO57_05315 [Acidithiobacillus sp.]|nr:hypothetical protein [Acidithiobacillus sp.]